MPRTAEQSAALREKRRTKMLEKALRLFASLSFDDLTIDDIASACNCSHGLFYHYFSSKEDVYNALMTERHLKHPDWECPIEKILAVGGYKGLEMAFAYINERLHGCEPAVLYLHMDLLRPCTTLRKSEPLLGPNIYDMVLKLVKKSREDNDIVLGDPEELTTLIIDSAIGATTRRINLGTKTFKTADIHMMLALGHR